MFEKLKAWWERPIDQGRKPCYKTPLVPPPPEGARTGMAAFSICIGLQEELDRLHLENAELRELIDKDSAVDRVAIKLNKQRKLTDALLAFIESLADKVSCLTDLSQETDSAKASYYKQELFNIAGSCHDVLRHHPRSPKLQPPPPPPEPKPPAEAVVEDRKDADG